MTSNKNETTEEEREFLRRRYFREQPSTREFFSNMKETLLKAEKAKV